MYIELLKFEGIYVYICIDCLDFTWFFTYVVGLLCFGTVFSCNMQSVFVWSCSVWDAVFVKNSVLRNLLLWIQR